MIQETLWNGIELLLPEDGFRLGTDSVVCAGFARFAKGSRVADLGCGSGAIAMMLLASDPSLQVTGMELDEQAALWAQKNAQHNHVNFSAIHGDLRKIRELLPSGSMDGCISNPPYFPVGSGKQASGPLAKARSEETCSLEDLTAAAAWLLPTGGTFTFVHRPERLADIIFQLKTHHLEPKRIQFTRHKAQSPVNLVLIEAKKGGKTGLIYEKDLIFFNEDGSETDDYKTLYHRKD